MNPHRISLPDIDTDYSERDREWVMNYLFNMEGIDASLIITFNTIALKGAIRDVGRYMKKQNPEKYNNEVIDYICKCVDEDKEDMVREEYKDLFEFVDILNGTVVSIGSHPAGVVVSPVSITKNLGTCMLADNDKPVTMVDMKEVDGLNFIKLDVLGLDTIGIINETCDLLGIDRITPDTVDIYDEKVWESIIKDTTNIFQMESDMAHQYLERITSRESINKIKESHPDIKMFDLFQLVCSMIRPGGANMRDDASKGICKENGIKELDDMLGDTLGYLLLQEQIMQFLVKFCNYTEAESDTVRRAIGKKSGTEDLLPEIERRFLEYAPNKFGLSEDVSKHIIKDTLQTILDCSNYSFSKNHNYPYSFTGYIAGYLRYYYPLEFATACLNTWTQKKKKDKINDTTAYIKKVGITIRPPKFRYSRAEYFMDKDTNSIYKGISSIKYLNKECAEGLYSLKDNKYDTFLDLLIDIYMKNISVNSRQMGILISIDYFSEFGKSQKLFDILDIFNNIMMKKFKSKKGEVSFNKEGLTYSKELIEKYSTEKSKEEKYKQYKIEDAYGLCNELIKDIDNIEMPSINKIKVYIETMGECDYKFEDYNPCTCIVIEAITKYKTKRIKIYNIATGLIKELKIGEGIFNYQPLKSLDVIDIYHLFQKPKKEAITVEVTDKEGNVVLDENGNPKTKNKWIPTGEFETWCDQYHLYDEEDIEAINREEYEYIISLEEEK